MHCVGKGRGIRLYLNGAKNTEEPSSQSYKGKRFIHLLPGRDRKREMITYEEGVVRRAEDFRSGNSHLDVSVSTHPCSL